MTEPRAGEITARRFSSRAEADRALDFTCDQRRLQGDVPVAGARVLRIEFP